MTDTQAAQIRELINTIRADPKHPFNNPASPFHAVAVREMNARYDALYPSAETGSDDVIDIAV